MKWFILMLFIGLAGCSPEDKSSKMVEIVIHGPKDKLTVWLELNNGNKPLLTMQGQHGWVNVNLTESDIYDITHEVLGPPKDK
jgi:hypothetical protein